jgi:hypothetical protein
MQIAEKRQIPNKSLSIRVCTDGLSFCVYSPTEEEPYKYVVYKVKPTISLAANLKTALNSEPILQSDYQRVNVLVTTPKFTTVPVVAFKSEDIVDVFNFNFPKEKPQHVSYNVLRRAGIAIIFGLEKNVYQLIRDDFPRARFYASSSTLIEYFAERSMFGNNKKMFVYLHESEMTLYCFDQGCLVFVNSYPVRTVDDCQYYILNVWQQLGFDQIDDMLFIVSDNDMREQLSTKISYFLSNVDVVDRREDFRHTITKGNSEIPYDLQTLLVCGF